MSIESPLPEFLQTVLDGFIGRAHAGDVTRWLRPADICMTPKALSAYKSSRVSFARVLARRMIDERWNIERKQFSCDAEGLGYGRYEITAAGHRFTYVSRPYRWDGIEKVGRRTEGAKRDMYGAMFIGQPDEARIAQEVKTFDYRDWDLMRTDSTVAGWTPGSRSARFFDLVVDTLTAGRQPDPAVIGEASGYLIRNGGYLACGRFGTLAYEGYPENHPLHHPFFADQFGLFMLRQVSIDLVNGIAAARNPNAARLAPDIARYLGVGNSSGQGMCVAMQRWPHWVSTWVTTRELPIAYAKSMPVAAEKSRWERAAMLLSRAADYYRSVIPTCHDFIVPHPTVATNLETMRAWTLEAARGNSGLRWGDLTARAEKSFDAESVEQINSLLIETYWEFADAAADYLPIGAERERDVAPEMRVAALRDLLRRRYAWALRYDLSLSRARQHFWYHSVDSGEQRRGDRVVDPHEEFESFIDHIGLIQRLAAVLDSYDDQTPVAELVADAPELGFAVSRVQYLAGLPYTEIRGNLVDKDFLPSDLIRFMLATLGMECTTPLSIRQVRGVFFQGMPLIEELARGADPDWSFPPQPKLREPELAAE